MRKASRSRTICSQRACATIKMEHAHQSAHTYQEVQPIHVVEADHAMLARLSARIAYLHVCGSVQVVNPYACLLCKFIACRCRRSVSQSRSPMSHVRITACETRMPAFSHEDRSCLLVSATATTGPTFRRFVDQVRW